MHDPIQTTQLNGGGEQALPSAPVTNAAAPAPQKLPVTSAQKWLLLATLIVGVVWRMGWEIAWDDYWYGTFWLVAMAAVTPFIWRRALKSRTGMAIGGAAVALCVLRMVRGGGMPDDLLGYLTLSIPAVMMLYLVFAAYDIPVKREGAAARLALAGVFVYPFTGVPQFFAAIGALFSGKKRGAWKRVLPGAALEEALAIGVTLLLMEADANMHRLFQRLLYDIPFWEWFGRISMVFVTAMLFYGVFERAIRKEHPPLPAYAPGRCPASTMTAILIPPLVIYAVFVCLQFSYLFGGSLPAELTYSEYARAGFMQLNLVAAINFTLFGLSRRYVEQSRLIRVLCALLLAANAGIVASCVVRLLLYIGAYGLTILRILPLWLACFLAALTALCAVRLARESFPVLRIGGIVFLYWYVALNIPNWNAVIVAYNAAHGMG